jgi:hypothetical protein
MEEIFETTYEALYMGPTCQDEAGFEWRARGSKAKYWGAHEDPQAMASTNNTARKYGPTKYLVRRAYQEALETGPIVLPFMSRHNPCLYCTSRTNLPSKPDLAYDSQTVNKSCQARNGGCRLALSSR